METVTPKELALLDRIVRDEYQPTNGSIPETFEDLSVIWSCNVLESQSDGGVFSSLQRKGLADADIHGDDDDTLWITRKGYDAWLAARVS